MTDLQWFWPWHFLHNEPWIKVSKQIVTSQQSPITCAISWLIWVRWRFYWYSLTSKWYFHLNVGLNLPSSVIIRNKYMVNSIHNTFFIKRHLQIFCSLWRVYFSWFTEVTPNWLTLGICTDFLTSDVVCQPHVVKTIRRFLNRQCHVQRSSSVFPESYNNYASLEEVMHVHEGGIIVLW